MTRFVSRKKVNYNPIKTPICPLCTRYLVEHTLKERHACEGVRIVMASQNLHKDAWIILRERILLGKTSWGKNELQRLMSACLEEAFERTADTKEKIT